ncbi:MAG: transposase [Nanoarchaeota archaeon]|nr:transposase [Nanoarchaeota archaeon]
MPRIARLVAVGLPHHVTQRGNYQQQVFADDQDKEIYLSFIILASKKFELTILSYCLMDNHVHFIAVPKEDYSLAKTFNTAHMRYSQYYNKKQGLRGHLWQGRFYSCILDEQHLLSAAKYIERNPVRTKLVSRPWQWKFSSANTHCGGEEKYIYSARSLFDHIDMNRKQWREYIGEQDKKEELNEIKKHTMSGRPLGGAEFVTGLEKKFKRRLHALNWGRPRKSEK